VSETLLFGFVMVVHVGFEKQVQGFQALLLAGPRLDDKAIHFLVENLHQLDQGDQILFQKLYAVRYGLRYLPLSFQFIESQRNHIA